MAEGNRSTPDPIQGRAEIGGNLEQFIDLHDEISRNLAHLDSMLAMIAGGGEDEGLAALTPHAREEYVDACAAHVNRIKELVARQWKVIGRSSATPAASFDKEACVGDLYQVAAMGDMLRVIGGHNLHEEIDAGTLCTAGTALEAIASRVIARIDVKLAPCA